MSIEGNMITARFLPLADSEPIAITRAILQEKYLPRVGTYLEFDCWDLNLATSIQPRCWYLNFDNVDLMYLYELIVMNDSWEDYLISYYHPGSFSKRGYLELRDKFNSSPSYTHHASGQGKKISEMRDRSAMFYYLARLCYQHRPRYSRKKEFNAAYRSMTSPLPSELQDCIPSIQAFRKWFDPAMERVLFSKYDFDSFLSAYHQADSQRLSSLWGGKPGKGDVVKIKVSPFEMQFIRKKLDPLIKDGATIVLTTSITNGSNDYPTYQQALSLLEKEGDSIKVECFQMRKKYTLLAVYNPCTEPS